jgi:hypothetical protein
MATCDLFPQNMATFVVFFPKKKVVVQFELGFFIVKMKKLAQKKH